MGLTAMSVSLDWKTTDFVDVCDNPATVINMILASFLSSNHAKMFFKTMLTVGIDLSPVAEFRFQVIFKISL